MAELKSLIVKGASRFLNGVVADSITATTATISSLYLDNPLAVSSGGLGVNTLTADGLLTGNGNSSVTAYKPDWQDWVTGTTAGPKAKIKLGNKDYTSDPIPAATSAISGIITTTNQDIAGIKNFVQNIRLNNAGYIGGLVSGSNRYLCLGTTDGTTDTRYIVLNSSSLRPNSSVAADIDLGSSDQPWGNFYTLNNYIYNSNKTQTGRFGSAVLGTTTTNGETRFVLGNSIGSGSDNNSYGTFFLYGTGTRYAKITYDGLTYHTNWHIPSYGTSANEDIYFAHIGGTSSVGSNTQPVYVAENGRLTAITGALTNGSAYLTNYNHYSNSATQTINLDNNEVAVGAMFHFTVKKDVTGSPGADSTILQMNWANSSGYNSQFGIQTGNDRAFFRRQSAGTWQNWQEIAHGPLNTQVGSSTKPVYLSNTGTITEGTQYAGGTNVTLNGISQGGSIANIYAPTTGATAGYVLQANGSGNNAPTWRPNIYYGTCSTAGATVAKEVTISDFPSTLVEGQIVYVKFTYANSATSASLNVNNTGAKEIRFGDQATANRNGRAWATGDTLGFIYDGSYWRLISAYAKSALNSYMSQFVTTRASATATATKYFIAGATAVNSSGTGLYLANNTSSTVNSSGIYFLGSEGVLYGAAWNDYAEFRHSEEPIEAGRVVKELGNGTLELVNERLARGCEIVSDTFGFAIGETDYCQLPTAASGRVLAYPDKDPSTFEIGAPVCSGPNGTVSQMTEEEERLYPSRIIGTVSEIPTYEIWHGGKDVQVNGRIWIRIR